MHSTWTWTSVPGCFLALALAGCEGPSSTELSGMPMHHLDLSRPPQTIWQPAPPPSPSPGDRPPAVSIETNLDKLCRSTGYRPWRHIVIHHSATNGGNAAMFDKLHRGKGWDELGYHFIIDNGDGGPDGCVEVGRRWRVQKWGAHCGGTPNNEYNNFGIGICLVGDFTRQSPSPAQVQSLRRLVLYISEKYDIPAAHVIGHQDAPNAATACPGRLLHRYVHTTLRTEVTRQLAASR